jgi:hypothetical protein
MTDEGEKGKMEERKKKERRNGAIEETVNSEETKRIKGERKDGLNKNNLFLRFAQFHEK